MTITRTAFLVAALICFVAAAFGVPSKVNLEAAGLALLTAAWLA